MGELSSSFWNSDLLRRKAFAMKHTIIPIFLFGFTVVGLGQSPSPSETNERHFRWSQRNAHELDHSKTIRTSTELSPAEKASLIETIAAQIRVFKRDLEIGSERELRQVVAETRIKLIDLNNDGIAEVLAQAYGLKEGCGATGNCSFWVFQKTAAGFKKLLDTRGKDGVGGIEVITVNPNRTNGFSDLVLGAHDSASERTLLVYQYRNGQYGESECYKANWLSTKEGKWRVLKNPKITRCQE